MPLYQYLDGPRVGITHLPVRSMWSKISCHTPVQSNSPRPNLSMVSSHCSLVPWSFFYCVWNPPSFLPLSVDFTPNIADLSPTSHQSLCRAGVVNTHLEGCLCLSLQCDEQRFCFLGECTEHSERQMQGRLLFCFATSDVSPEKKQTGQHTNLVLIMRNYSIPTSPSSRGSRLTLPLHFLVHGF